MKLVNEDENGAYLGVRAEFLKKFVLKENNPNFEVYDAKNGNNRFIVVKASRLPDDEDLSAGRYGINFHRAKPDFKDARLYHAELTTARISRQSLNGLAFAAETREQYDSKSAAWDSFYTYIWGQTPQNIWVTPHSGNINRAPDNIFPYPKLEMDAYAASTAAWCAMHDTLPALKRTMISIHSHNWYSAVVDLGDFGINDGKKMENTAAVIEEKYADKVQPAMEACRRDFTIQVMPWLEHVLQTIGTLNPQEMPPEYGIERSVVYYAATGLKLYNKEITRFTLAEFQEAIESLKDARIRVASHNHLFSGQQISRQLQLADQVQRGRMNGAVQIECMKFYLKHAPALVAEIILDIKQEMFR
jgi:hypothetical protein